MNHEYLSAQQFTSLIPKGWRQNSIPKLQYLLESIKPTEQKITEQERRWTEITGVLPKDTHVTIIVPIRNGGKYLAPMLHTLASADIPRSAHATFIFITNNCTDNGLSNHAVNSLLHTLGHVEKEVLMMTSQTRSKIKEWNMRIVELSLTTRNLSILTQLPLGKPMR